MPNFSASRPQRHGSTVFLETNLSYSDRSICGSQLFRGDKITTGNSSAIKGEDFEGLPECDDLVLPREH